MGRRIRANLTMDKNGIWTARVTIGRRHLSRTTGTRIREEAELFLARLVLMLECGSKQIAQRAPLAKFWPRYETSAGMFRISEATRKNKRRAWLNFSAWAYRTHPDIKDVRAITGKVAEEYMCFFQRWHAAITCNLRLCMLREITRVLLDGGANPWSDIRLRSRDSHTRRELTLDEVRRLVAASQACGEHWRMHFPPGNLHRHEARGLLHAEVGFRRSRQAHNTGRSAKDGALRKFAACHHSAAPGVAGNADAQVRG